MTDRSLTRFDRTPDPWGLLLIAGVVAAGLALAVLTAAARRLIRSPDTPEE